MVTKKWSIGFAEQGPCLRALRLMVPPGHWEESALPSLRVLCTDRRCPGCHIPWACLAPCWGVMSSITSSVPWFFSFHIQKSFLPPSVSDDHFLNNFYRVLCTLQCFTGVFCFLFALTVWEWNFHENGNHEDNKWLSIGIRYKSFNTVQSR